MLWDSLKLIIFFLFFVYTLGMLLDYTFEIITQLVIRWWYLSCQDIEVHVVQTVGLISN